MSHDDHHHDHDHSQPPLCDHLRATSNVEPKTKGCEECLASGDSWMHLRLCLSCGHVGCCDQSKNRHATRHAWTQRHETVRSLEAGENWRWCYADALGIEG